MTATATRRRQAAPPRPERGVEIREHRRTDGTVWWTFRVRWKDPVTGRRVSEEFDTMDEALDWRAKRRLDRRRGVGEATGDRQTLRAFEAEWWSTYVLVELEPGTRPSYRRILDRHVLPALGDLQLRQLTPETLIRWRAAMTEQGVGDPTIRKAMAIVQSILARAVEWLRIQSNPAREVRKPARTQRAVRPLPPIEIERLRARMPTTRDRALICLIGYAGLRPEEALALQWHHIRQRTILIEQKVVDGVILTGQKTRRPPRTVDLLAPLRPDLDAHRPDGWHPDDLVFPNQAGGPWTATEYGEWRARVFAPVADLLRGRPTADQVKAARRRAARGDEQAREEAQRLQRARETTKGTRPYQLRHSFASLLIHEGRLSVREIADQLGHSIQTLLTTYTHIINELRDAPKVPAVEEIEQARAQVEQETTP